MELEETAENIVEDKSGDKELLIEKFGGDTCTNWNIA